MSMVYLFDWRYDEWDFEISDGDRTIDSEDMVNELLKLRDGDRSTVNELIVKFEETVNDGE